MSRASWTAAAVVVTALCARTAWGYLEDVGFGLTRRNTAHYDLTRALARCAGYSADQARTIAEANEATDTGTYGSTTVGFTARMGDAGTYFHYPQHEGSLPMLLAWARGEAPLFRADHTTLVPGCTMDGGCCNPTNGTGCVDKGTLEALGVYLHSVGDLQSHLACTQAGGTTHSDFDHSDLEQVQFCPVTTHQEEFGAGATLELGWNAYVGLQNMRAEIAAFHGATCVQVTDLQLSTFATAEALGRATYARDLFEDCDDRCP